MIRKVRNAHKIAHVSMGGRFQEHGAVSEAHQFIERGLPGVTFDTLRMQGEPKRERESESERRARVFALCNTIKPKK